MADIRPTPEQRPVVGGLARLLQRADQFARKPFGYENPPVAMISDLLSVPQLYRTMENYAYGSPLASGTSSVSRYLPKLTEDTKGAIEGATNLLPLVGPAARATKTVASAAAPYAARQAVNLAEKYGVAPTMSVVKPKGGNWLKGSIENKLVPLKSPDEETAIQAILRANPNIDREAARQFVIADSAVPPQNLAINRWIDTKLAKYIRNEMGTPEDPVRELAERGVLHFQPRGFRETSPAMDTVRINRGYGGFPVEDAAASPLAKQWERYADEAIEPVPSQTRVAGLELTGDFRAQKTLEDNPWLKTLPRDTLVYEPGYRAFVDHEMLGFPHLIDELKTAMSPTSDLPMNLRLNPKDIDKLTVPQAVERVSKINAWRAEQAAIAEREGMMANLKAEPRLADENLQLSFVEKPGGAWVDIPETVDQKGMQLCTSIGKAGGWCTQHEHHARSYGSGENRLATLLDTEGRPHAQAKITSVADDSSAFDAVIDDLTPAQDAAWEAHFGARRGPPELSDAVEWLEQHAPNVYKKYQDILANTTKEAPAITELKPPGNSFGSDRAQEYIRRDPQYKQKVTNSVLNFLNSGEWGHVSDLHHYDIVDLKDPNSLMDGLKTLYGDESSRRIGQEFIDAFNHAVAAEPNANRFMTPRQLRDFIGPVEPLEGYARGGAVDYDPDEIAQLAASVAEGLAPYGLRHSGEGVKGKGYFGPMAGRKGTVTELSAEDDTGGEYPLVVPTLTTQELEMLLADQEPTEAIQSKARSWANTRRARGQSPFAGPTELRMPRPGYAAGGLVDYDPTEIDAIVSQLKEEFHG